MPSRPRECGAEVTAVRSLNPDVIEVDLRMVEPAVLPFAAGQWVSVPFGPKIVRAYSMASPPGAGHELTLSVDVAPGETLVCHADQQGLNDGERDRQRE